MPEKDHNQDIKINTLEINYSTMSEQLKDLKLTVDKGFSDIKKEFKNIHLNCQMHQKENDQRYANKRIEKVVDNLTWLVISTVVLAGLGLLFL